MEEGKQKLLIFWAAAGLSPFITPAVEKSGWNTRTQLLEEVSFTDGKIYVRGKLTARGNQKRADYIRLKRLLRKIITLTAQTANLDTTNKLQ